MKRLGFVLLALLMAIPVLAGRGASAQMGTEIKVASDPALGAILTDSAGMTLYLFTKDTVAGESTCYDKCAVNWPPVPADGATLAAGVPGTLGSIARTDGVNQLTYNDIPLYYWINDKAAGETTGEGVGGVWYVVAPGSSLVPYEAAPGEGTPVPTTTLRVGYSEELGPYLIGDTGMTVYLFTNDTVAGESACYDKCATNWPPVPASDSLHLQAGVPGTLGSITRTDGTTQLTYNDIPLYYWINDKAVGDTTGQEVGDVWYIVVPGQKLGDPPHEAEAMGSPEAGS